MAKHNKKKQSNKKERERVLAILRKFWLSTNGTCCYVYLAQGII
jgi:hypothetical protein